MEPTATSSPVKVNRPAIVLTVVLATAAGILPWVLVVGEPRLIFVFALLAAFLAFLPLRNYRTFALRRPTFLEYAFGGGGALVQPAVAALLGIVFYIAFRWLAIGANRLFRMFDWDYKLDPLSVAFGVSLVVVLVMLLGLVGWSKNLARQLFPQAAGIQSAFYQLVHGRHRRRTLKWALVGIVALLLVEWGAAFLFPRAVRSTGWNLVLAFLLVGIASPLSELGEGTVTEGQGKTVDALAKLLEQAGYRVTPSPRTGRPEIDPLLTRVDLFAESTVARYAFALQKIGDDFNHLLACHEEISTGAWALDKSLQPEGSAKQEKKPSDVCTTPVLVLQGKDPAGLLRMLERQVSTPLIHLADDSLPQLVRRSEPAELRRMVESWGLLVSDESPPTEPAAVSPGEPA